LASVCEFYKIRPCNVAKRALKTAFWRYPVVFAAESGRSNEIHGIFSFFRDFSLAGTQYNAVLSHPGTMDVAFCSPGSASFLTNRLWMALEVAFSYSSTGGKAKNT
jgi:hypothetical protein